jgi:hypothetical protein
MRELAEMYRPGLKPLHFPSSAFQQPEHLKAAAPSGVKPRLKETHQVGGKRFLRFRLCMRAIQQLEGCFSLRISRGDVSTWR